MTMTLFSKEFKWKIKSLISWMIILLIFLLIYVPFTDQLLQESKALLDFMKKMPQLLLKLFNIDPKVFSSPEGLLGSEGMSFIFIFMGIFAINFTNDLFSKEFERKTIEFLSTKPITRKRIFWEKISVFLIYSMFLTIFFILSEFATFRAFVHEEYNSNILLGFGLYILTVQIFFGGLNTLVSIISKNSSLSFSITFGLHIFMFFIAPLSEIYDSLKPLGKISIFTYISLKDTVIKQEVYAFNSLIIILIGFILMYISSVYFEKSEILI